MPDRVDAPADGPGLPLPAPPEPPGPPPSRGAIAALVAWAGLLREPGFQGLWLAQTVSQLGTQVTLLAMPLVAILTLGASPLEVGVLTAIDFLLRETIAISSIGGLVAAGVIAVSPLRSLRVIPSLAEAPPESLPEPAATISAPPTGV